MVSGAIAEFFKNLKFDVFYKPIFSLSSIILGLSLFLPVIVASQAKVQLFSFIGVLYSILAWFINETFAVFVKNINERREKGYSDYWLMMVLFHVFIQACFLVTFIYFLIHSLK